MGIIIFCMNIGDICCGGTILKKQTCDVSMYFIGPVTLFFANSLTTLQRNIESPWNVYTIFSDPEVIFSSHTICLLMLPQMNLLL